MTELEIFWGIATGVALLCAIVALVSSLRTLDQTRGDSNLEVSIRAFQVADIKKDHVALERTVDSQTKRLNDHYSAIAGLRAESRRQRSELRQLTRTTEAVSANQARAAVILSQLIKSGRAVVVSKKNRTKK